MWKKCIKQTSENTSFLVVKDHHLLLGSRIIILEKLSSKDYIIADFCNRAISLLHKNILIIYFQIRLRNIELPWKEMYLAGLYLT